MAQIKLEVTLERDENSDAYTFRIQVPHWLKQKVQQHGAFVSFDSGYYSQWGDLSEVPLYISFEKRKNDDVEDNEV